MDYLWNGCLDNQKLTARHLHTPAPGYFCLDQWPQVYSSETPVDVWRQTCCEASEAERICRAPCVHGPSPGSGRVQQSIHHVLPVMCSCKICKNKTLWLQSFRTTVAHLWVAFHHISSPVSNFGHDCVWDLLKEVELGGTLSFTWAGDTLDMWLKVTSMYLCDTGQPSWLRNASMVFLLPISLTSWHRGAGSELCQNVN